MRYFNYLLSLFLLTLILSCSHYGSRHIASTKPPETLEELIPHRTYLEIKRISLEILQHCPPEDCIVIGLGRSPTPITAFLKQIDKDTMNLPLSGFKIHPELIEYSSDIEHSLHKHFYKYVDTTKIDNKKVLLVDYSLSGESLFSAHFHLQKFLRSINMTNTVSSLAIAPLPGHVKSTAEKLFIKDYTLVIPEEGQLQTNLIASWFDDYAEFGEARVEQWGNVAKNSKHEKLLLHIKEYFDADADLQGITTKNYRHYLPDKILNENNDNSCYNWMTGLLSE